VPVLEDVYSNPNRLFLNSLGIWSESGDLTLTVAEKAKIDAKTPFRIVLKMRNRKKEEARKECWRYGHLKDSLIRARTNACTHTHAHTHTLRARTHTHTHRARAQTHTHTHTGSVMRRTA
jgi:hypothetical protein